MYPNQTQYPFSFRARWSKEDLSAWASIFVQRYSLTFVGATRRSGALGSGRRREDASGAGAIGNWV